MTQEETDLAFTLEREYRIFLSDEEIKALVNRRVPLGSEEVPLSRWERASDWFMGKLLGV
jgi:hypothetical protein